VLAREGSQNVFLVDLDLRSPSINHYLGVDREESSITRFYKEDRDLSGLLITFEQNGLFVIGNNGPGIENSSELISSERSEKLLAELKSMDPNGIFLFDLPPVLPTDDVLAFAPLLDAALVVVSEGRTRRDNIVKSFDLLNGASIEVAGVVLNMAGEGNVDAYY
jgi:Mrp family chromosome partitioning ATPase